MADVARNGAAGDNRKRVKAARSGRLARTAPRKAGEDRRVAVLSALGELMVLVGRLAVLRALAVLMATGAISRKKRRPC